MSPQMIGFLLESTWQTLEMVLFPVWLRLFLGCRWVLYYWLRARGTS